MEAEKSFEATVDSDQIDEQGYVAPEIQLAQEGKQVTFDMSLTDTTGADNTETE